MEKDYRIVKGYSLTELSDQVKDWLVLDWKLQGGICVSTSTASQPVYLQAMTLNY